MERLTKRNKDGLAYYPKCFKEPCAGMGCQKNFCENELRYCEKLAAYEDTGKTPEEVAALLKAESEGRLVVLSEPMIPLVCSDDMTDSDVYCPKCGETLSGGWEKADADCSLKLFQCFHCGQSIDDSRAITREAAEAALAEMEGE